MKKILTVALSLMILGDSFGSDWKGSFGNSTLPVICYASGKSLKSYVGPPQHLKNANGKSSIIVVDYIGFSDEARQAFQYAVDIWKELVYTPVPIHVLANWTSLEPGVLGSCRPSDKLSNFEGTEVLNYDYPIALAEKIAGKELNAPGNYEIIAYFNKDLPSWYLGTDGNCPANKYDFVSVVLHEITHGLGFTGNFYSTRGRGGYSYNSDGLAATFDMHIINKNGNLLINKSLYANPSVALNQNLISGWLNFDTDLSGSELPRLYAPTTWKDGSSIYHLDEGTYKEENINSLMTPFTNAGEVVHDPGPHTINIINDIGWKTVTVIPEKIKDLEGVVNPINFKTRILSDNGLDLNKIYVIYSSNKFAKKDSVLLKPAAVSDLYSAIMPITQAGTHQYFISATDGNGRRYTYPSTSPAVPLSFKIGSDNEPPVVNYLPIKNLMDTDPKVKIIANVTDNLGIKAVNLEYFLPGGLVKSLPLKNDSDDIYSAELSFETGSVKDEDVINYRVVATDASSKGNIGKYPVSGYSNFRIEGFRNPVEYYTNSFDTKPYDFIKSDFTVSTTSGFDNPALNSPHPYASPEVDNGSFDFVSVLKYPIILKSGTRMSYDEIVLVEPGDTGTVYGDENFFDYVIVEGSKDEGTTWLPLIDGYDSNSLSSWSTKYNGSISGQNSLAVPAKDLFNFREFGLLSNQNFAAGDTILVRFRLYSDPYANGWGWVVDNLKVFDDGTSGVTTMLSPGEVQLYPNPASDLINLKIQAKNNFKTLNIRIYNSSGSLVLNHFYPVGSNLFQTTVDIKNLNPGLYLFIIEPEKGNPVVRKVLIR